MSENPIKQLYDLGQSVWLDYLGRSLITTGKLKMMVDDGITGVTSNPSIFQKAITGSTDYDEGLRALLDKGERDEKELFINLAVEDVSNAADIFRTVYESTGGEDGYISIEVSPDLAYDTNSTIEEAKRLFKALGKKNILIKVPATKEGLPAIESLISDGINVNVTLLFSVKRYEDVMEAYIKGLEKRVQNGQPINEIFSVASFFVSRVDTLVDRLLEEKLSVTSDDANKDKIRNMSGRSAVANAKIANKKYVETFFHGSRFKALKDKGAHIQKLLWGSTGTKNPAYSDVKYVEEIIAPHSINTLPEATINAFKDHGKAEVTINDNMNDAEELFDDLSSVGVEIESVTDQLEKEGVKLFSDSFFALLNEIAEKRDRLLSAAG
jgi:transaldolase/glucose-6-phosphate isomerase